MLSILRNPWINHYWCLSKFEIIFMIYYFLCTILYLNFQILGPFPMILNGFFFLGFLVKFLSSEHLIFNQAYKLASKPKRKLGFSSHYQKIFDKFFFFFHILVDFWSFHYGFKGSFVLDLRILPSENEI